MSLNPLFPVAGDHAIETLACALQWNPPLSEKDLREVRTRVQQRLHSYKVFNDHKTVTFSIKDGAPAPSAPAAIAGFTAIPSTPIGGARPTRSLAVTPDELVIELNEYHGWEKVREELARTIDGAVGGVLDRVGLTALNMQYTDSFQWRAESAQLKLDEVFRRDTPYLSPGIFGLTSYWHCNQGFFSQARWRGKQQLINVNVQRHAPNDIETLTIVTLHRLPFAEPIWGSSDEKQAVIGELYEVFHDDNKALLKQLLTDSVCEKIHLTKKA